MMSDYAKKYYWLFLILLYSALFLPFLKTIPYLDGNIDFVQAVDFFKGGFGEYLKNWSSVHPPLKLFIAQILFNLLGVNAISYNLAGYFLGILGIISLFYLAKKLTDEKTAFIAVLLLALSSLYLSTSLFWLRDFLLTVLILAALVFYNGKKYFLFLIFLLLVVITKETGLILPISIILVEAFFLWRNPIPTALSLISLGSYAVWSYFLKSAGSKPWSDWIFSATAEKGSFYTAVHNFLSGDFLNKYAFQQWQQIFILNFNWVYWLIFIIGIIIYVKRRLNHHIAANENREQTKTVFIIITFSVIFFFGVLSFPTYTIPRYGLPLIPFLLLGTAWGIKIITKEVSRCKNLLSFLVVITVILSLFFSIDPVSTTLWGKMKIYGMDFYNLPANLDGNDGLTYNFQYLFLAKKRSDEVREANKNKRNVVSRECYWVFPDPNNDSKTVKILKLEELEKGLNCLNRL